MPLLTRVDRENLHKYRYSGGDSSPIYEYVLSPLAQFCVDHFTPLWLAPNLVTLLGLAASVLSMVLTLVYNPDLSEDGPSWLHLLNGVCVFAYQTFDNMDGKQARRSGSSSPLGMLFDHGCDAINAGVMCIPMASVIGSGWSPLMFMCIWNGFVPFYFQAWEEFYTGSMVLPPFNGPTEGLLLAVGMCFVSFFNGAHWWHESVLQLPPGTASDLIASFYGRGVTPFFLVCAFSFTVSSLIALKQVWTVVALTSKSGRSGKALLDLLPFLVFLPSALYWLWVSPVAFKVYPLVSFLFISSSLVEMLVHIMLCHICRGELKPWERYGAYLTALMPALVHLHLPPVALPLPLSPSLPLSYDVEVLALIVVCLFSFTRTSVLLYQVCTEIAAELGIFVFKQGKRHKA